MIDLIIRNGCITDGTGEPSYEGDIAINQGKIIAIKNKINDHAKEEIDVSGLIVAPGFIDVHSHNDLVPFMNNQIKKLKIHQGVTTELVGQCGLGVVPLSVKKNRAWKEYITGVVGNLASNWEFDNFSQYFKNIKASGLKNNVASLISHGAIRTYVMGFEERKPNEKELNEMIQVLEDAMKNGVFGMSLGLQYLPGIFSSKAELITLCKVVKKYDGIVMVHLRNHDRSIIQALDEMIDISEASQVKLHISHMRSYHSKRFGCKADEILEIVNKTNIPITFDEHLYLSGSTLMTQLLPPWIMGDKTDDLIENLQDKDKIKYLKKELIDPKTQYSAWDNYSAVNGWNSILISSVKKTKNQKFLGKTVADIAKEENCHPVDFVAKLIIEEGSGVGIVTLNIFSLEDTMKLIQHPNQMVGSDSIPAGVPHPRLYGNFPLFIGKYVRDRGVLTLEEAIYKCTSLPAKLLGLKDIGDISIGKKADLTIFNYDTIMGYEDYQHPTLAPTGIEHVIISGKIALQNGEINEGNYGKVIKKNI